MDEAGVTRECTGYVSVFLIHWQSIISTLRTQAVATLRELSTNPPRTGFDRLRQPESSRKQRLSLFHLVDQTGQVLSSRFIQISCALPKSNTGL